jgi:GMP synthase (glutamine-hydrolysing)
LRVLVIHHEDWKLYLLRASSRQKHNNLGAFEAVLRDAGYAVDYHESATGHPLRATMDRYSHIICLGGNMAADEDEKHAFLREEMRTLEAAIAAGSPVLGICLGAQLLARIHGARVYPGERGPELGWHNLALTGCGRAEPALRAFPTEGPVFQWHHDTFDLPTGATHLARSGAYENQAYRVGSRVWGLQFHLEADATLVRAWLREYARVGGIDLAAVREATERHLPDLNRAAVGFIQSFLAQAS